MERKITKQGFEYRRIAPFECWANPFLREFKWIATTGYWYYSCRYGRLVYIPIWMVADGATGALDIVSLAWWAHDQLCNTGRWFDGALCTNWQASMVLKDILKSEGRWLRDHWWFWATFLFGGGKARENGMFFLRRKSGRLNKESITA